MADDSREEEALELLARYDANGSGTIDCAELLSLLRDMLHFKGGFKADDNLQAWADTTLSRFDQNGNGELDFDEVMPGCLFGLSRAAASSW